MRKLMFLIAGLVVAAGAVILLARTSRSEWTSTSPAAVEAFEAAQAARMKLYQAEAEKYLRRALELDPGFVAAKVVSFYFLDDKGREALVQELKGVDLSKLTDRERFLVEYLVARKEQRPEEADAILARFVERHPKDPYGLAMEAAMAWDNRDWDRAAGYYARLLDANPNWVVAQNHLGYIAMAQGRFEAAEELFKTYAYIAPDQANPHDSMGELLTLLGRYDEARAELEKALEIKPDFCASYKHLADILVMQGENQDASDILSAAAANCDPKFVANLRCEQQLWQEFLAGNFEAPWRPENASCVERMGPGSFLIHRMASLTGRRDEALAIEAAVAAEVEKKVGPMGAYGRKDVEAMLHHMRGVRLLGSGDPAAAASEFEAADKLLVYWGDGQGTLKLFNRLNLASALESSGDAAASQQLVAAVAGVNRSFAEVYPAIRESLAGPAGQPAR